MPKSKSRGVPMRGFKSQQDLLRESVQAAVTDNIDEGPVGEATPRIVRSRPRRISGGKLAVAGTLVGGGATAAAIAHRRKTVKKLYDPFEDRVVEFGKGAQPVGRLVPVSKAKDNGFIHLVSTGHSNGPTFPGMNPSSANKLVVIRRKRRGGKDGATALERYTGKN